MEKVIKKKIQHTKFNVSYIDMTNSRVIPFNHFNIAGVYNEMEIKELLNKEFGFKAWVIHDKTTIDRFFEIGEVEFTKNAKEITSKEYRNYYVKKGDK